MGTAAAIDELIGRRSLLGHPFYTAWSEGRLSRASLAGYSKEYYQLVKAVPRMMDPAVGRASGAAAAELAANRAEEEAHVPLWERFAGSLGVGLGELRAHPGLEKTRRAVADLSGLAASPSSGAAAMYALEKEIPEISRVKLEGLAEFYGMDSDDATEYFRVHREADVRHAASWEAALEGPEAGALEAADRSLSAQHLLLDACHEEYC